MIKVYFGDQGKTNHTKLVAKHTRFLSVGSHNFTDSALNWNNEASVMIDSPQLANKAASFMKEIER